MPTRAGPLLPGQDTGLFERTGASRVTGRDPAFSRFISTEGRLALAELDRRSLTADPVRFATLFRFEEGLGGGGAAGGTVDELGIPSGLGPLLLIGVAIAVLGGR